MNVLGVGAFVHDSAAALIVNGHLVGHIEEDRLSGNKHTKAYPEQAVAWLLDYAGLSIDDIDVVAYPFSPRLHARQAFAAAMSAPNWRTPDGWPRAASAVKVWRRSRQRIDALVARFPRARVVAVPHHSAHAAHAAAYAPRRPCCVLVVDSIGEHTTASVTEVDDGLPAPRSLVRDPHSLGYAYGAVTEHLGWRRGDGEGTVMALAAEGRDGELSELMRRGINLTASGIALNPDVFHPRVQRSGAQRIGWRLKAVVSQREAHEKILPEHADLAAALQRRTEEALLHLARIARRRTDASVLCLTGGVAANCLAVGAIAQSGLFQEVAVPPAPGDSGAAAGAAMAVWAASSRKPLPTLSRADLGPLPSPASREKYREWISLSREVSRRLAEGQIIGVCTGRAEAGPRALGRRTILANPAQRETHERLARRVKQRETFRPFAPAVLSNASAQYFVSPIPSPYMSFAVPVTAACRHAAPSVVHADGTARLQTVDDDRSFLALTLESFGALTGHPVLINTSLNVKGRPTACSSEDAIRAMGECRLDALVVDNQLIVSS